MPACGSNPQSAKIAHDMTSVPLDSISHTSIPSLYDLTLEQLTQQISSWGEPPFRAKQIWRWLYQRFAQDFDEMSDLGKPLRARLREHFALKRISVSAQQKSSDGWTRKWLLNFPDGSDIETVLMEYDGVRRTACISSQAGCAMNCSFCATGQMGFLRNLRAGEIIEQVVWVARQLLEIRDSRLARSQSPISNPQSQFSNPQSQSDRLSNLVLMGMGEPFANYNNVMEAVRRLMQPEGEGGFGLGARKITISTVGLVPGIRKFADEDTQVNLAVSLHAATDELRNQVVPINVKYPLKEVIKATGDYIKKTNRRVSYEWALIDGVNDTVEQARALVDVVDKTFPIDKRHLVHVNMIPLNPTPGYRGHASVQERRAKFQAVLEQAGIPNTMRVRRGIDIAAGCGQLKAEGKA
jgi:23S rRNA (adenine2503-C2)-methyltransferase